MNDKNIFIGVCEDNSLHINLVKGYIDDFFNEFHNYEVLEFVSGEDLLSNYPNNIDLLMQPDIVSGFRVRTEGNKIILNWNRNKNIDLLGYNIFANNYWIGTVDEEDTEFVFNKDILNVPEIQ